MKPYANVRLYYLPFPCIGPTSIFQHLVAEALGGRVASRAFLLGPENRVVFAGLPDDSYRYRTQNGKWGTSQAYLAQAIRQAVTAS